MQRYAITDRSLFFGSPQGWEGALLEQAEQWALRRVEWVQLREKDLAPPELFRLACRVAEAIRRAGPGTRLLISSLDPVRAREAGADGVHLPGGASSAMMQNAVAAGSVSVSCHSIWEVAAAREASVSAILWAPVFGKVVAGEEVSGGTGLASLANACETAGAVPVFALGGVSVGNAADCIAAGAFGVAGIRLFAGQDWLRLRD